MLGTICGAVVILRKLSHWQPVENIIRHDMNRQVQLEFVQELIQVCQEENVDPENLDKLIESAAEIETNGLSEIGGKISIVMMSFFRSRLKMQE